MIPKLATHKMMQSNRLTELPIEIGELRKLKEFYIDKIQLAELPKEMSNIPLLEILMDENFTDDTNKRANESTKDFLEHL